MPVQQGAARQYAAELFGGPVAEQESNPSISTTVASIVGFNGDRVGLVIVNQGANPLYISMSSAVSSTNGIFLAAAGGAISMDVTRDFTLPAHQWFGITTGGATNVYALEIFRVSL